MAKPKVIISTDLGGADNDDAQSMIHALLYSNDIDYRGFVMTRTLDGGVTTNGRGNGATMLQEMIDAYAADLPNLLTHDANYASAASLRAVIKTGSTDSAFPGTLSAGARHIITEARATTAADPIYLLGWGPIHDIAAALLAAPDIVSKVRVFSLSGLGQDTAHTDAYEDLTAAVAGDPRYHDLWWINSEETMRGMYISAKGDKYVGVRESLPWVSANIDGKGHLGDLYYDKYTYNISVTRPADASPDGLKMGDTPSLLYLLDQADNNDPLASSWGGSFVRSTLGTQTWTDNLDPAVQMGPHYGARTVFEHRSEIRDDFVERLDWAETPAQPQITGPVIETGVTEFETLKLTGYFLSSKVLAGQSGKIIEVSGKSGPQSGMVEGTFTGTAGDYAVTVKYLNENDGVSPYGFYVDDRLEFSWSGRGGTNAFTEITRTLHLEYGDVIKVTGAKHNGEVARLDYIDIEPIAGSAGSSLQDDFAFL